MRIAFLLLFALGCSESAGTSSTKSLELVDAGKPVNPYPAVDTDLPPMNDAAIPDARKFTGDFDALLNTIPDAQPGDVVEMWGPNGLCAQALTWYFEPKGVFCGRIGDACRSFCGTSQGCRVFPYEGMPYLQMVKCP